MTSDITSKGEIREQLSRRRESLDDAERIAASQMVDRRLRAWQPFEEREHVAGYVAADNEIDISGALEERLEAGGDVRLPRVVERTPPTMEFAPIETFDALRDGAYGIPEPPGPAGDLSELDLIFVPGLAFDRSGRRIGRGAGFYDRTLAERLARCSADSDEASRRDDVLFVGVCYDFQLRDAPLPSEPHDIDLDVIVTEHEFIQTFHG